MLKEIIRIDNLHPIKKGYRTNLYQSTTGKGEFCEGKLGGQVWRPAPLKVEFRKMLIPLPLLFLSGVFTGIGIMLALN